MQSCGTEGWNDNYTASDWIFNRKEKVIYKTTTNLANSTSFQTPIWPRNTTLGAVKVYADEC